MALSLSGCWFNFMSEDWEQEPQYVSPSSLSFSGSTDYQTLYISNVGGHSQISFTVTVDVNWLSPSVTEGIIEQGKEASVRIGIVSKFLPEGENSGTITVNVDGDVWKVSVTAAGENNIVVNPTRIDFGSTDDSALLNLRSLTGTRNIVLDSSDDWLTVSESDIKLTEYDPESGDGETSVTVNCKRGLLKAGDYSSSIIISNTKGDKLVTIPVTTTVASQNPLTVAIDNFVFTLSKHLYFENDNAILELTIKNYKYFRVFQLDGDSSYAIGSNGTEYSVGATSESIRANETGVMNVTIKNVDRSVSSFSEIHLVIKDLSAPVVFNNVELQ